MRKYGKWLLDQVIAAMKEAAIQGSGVSVEVQNGVAILDGKVSKASDRTLAQRLAQTVPGIQSVENNLRFVPEPRSQVQPAAGELHADLFDSGVTQAGLSEAKSSASRIRQVSGEVPPVATPATRATVPAAPAPAAAGGQALNNQAVAQQIGDTLAAVGLVGYDIEIRFNAGTATLIGDVATAQQRQAAESSVSQIPSVKNVNNQLRVGVPASAVCTADDASWVQSAGHGHGSILDAITDRLCANQFQQSAVARSCMARLRSVSKLSGSHLSDAVQCQCLPIHWPVLSVPTGTYGVA